MVTDKSEFADRSHLRKRSWGTIRKKEVTVLVLGMLVTLVDCGGICARQPTSIKPAKARRVTNRNKRGC